jgi:hypothetical protein
MRRPDADAPKQPVPLRFVAGWAEGNQESHMLHVAISMFFFTLVSATIALIGYPESAAGIAKPLIVIFLMFAIAATFLDSAAHQK